MITTANRDDGVEVPSAKVIQKNRGDRRWTFPNEPAMPQLLFDALTYVEEFTADTYYRLAETAAE